MPAIVSRLSQFNLHHRRADTVEKCWQVCRANLSMGAAPGQCDVEGEGAQKCFLHGQMLSVLVKGDCYVLSFPSAVDDHVDFVTPTEFSLSCVYSN